MESFNDLFGGINLYLNDILYREMEINHRLGKIIYYFNINDFIIVIYNFKL